MTLTLAAAGEDINSPNVIGDIEGNCTCLVSHVGIVGNMISHHSAVPLCLVVQQVLPGYASTQHPEWDSLIHTIALKRSTSTCT